MTMLVTGAAGFIGSHLVDRLLAMDEDVIGVDDLSRGTRGNLAAALENPRFALIETDIGDPAAIDENLLPRLAGQRIDTIWHLAANSDILAGVKHPEIDLKNTFLTTFQMLRVARALEVPRFAFASTSAVYGEHPGRLAETAGPLLPISNYGAMKLASEAAISAAVEAYLKQACLYRFPNVVGARGTHGIIYDLFGKLKRDATELEVLGDGKQCKPYLHVEELVDAMIFIWRNAAGKIALYNIGPEDTGANVSFIAETVADVSRTGARLRYTGGDRGWVGDVPRVDYNVEKLGALGWRPLGSSHDAVRRAVDELAVEFGF